jgi:cytochrome c biogenesis protein CcmG/thiol:disulfide interchange protein DsbE
MNKFIPLAVLLTFLLLIFYAVSNINKNHNDNATSLDEASSEEISAKNHEGEVNFVETSIDLPDFIIPDIYESGKSFTKKDLMGKYTIINFFASWCSTCLAEHDILLRMQSEAVADLYGIAWRDINENTLKFLQKNGNPFSKVGADNKGTFSKIANIEAVPETWLINPKGQIVLRLKGNLHDFSIDEIKRYLKLH